MSSYYFEVLPVHPLPTGSEPLSGHLTRTMEANGVIDIASARGLLFPSATLDDVRNIRDFPRKDLFHYSVCLNVPVEIILETTLNPLANFFGRSSNTQNLSRFLSSSLNQHLHYCPQCIEEFSSYSLYWRFKSITACHIHNVNLRRTCPNCNQEIPIISTPFSIAHCSFCSGNLSGGKIESATNLDAQKQKIEDLKFIFEYGKKSSYPLDVLGRKLKYIRRERGFSKHEISNNFGISFYRQSELESESVTKSLDTFEVLLNYLEILGVSFVDLDKQETPNVLAKRRYANYSKSNKKYSDEDLKVRIQDAVDILRSSGKNISVLNIAEVSGISDTTLYRRRITLECVPELRSKKWKSSNEYKFQIVRETTEQLRDKNIPITLSSVSDLIGISVTSLLYYPEIQEYIKNQAQEQLEAEESVLLERLQYFEETSENIVRSEVISLIGVRLNKLRKYPKLFRKVMKYPIDRTRKMNYEERSIFYLKAVKKFIEENKGDQITQEQIASVIGLSVPACKKYPEIAKIMQEIADNWRERKGIQE